MTGLGGRATRRQDAVERRGGKTGGKDGAERRRQDASGLRASRRCRSRRGDCADMGRSVLRPYTRWVEHLRGWVRNYSCCFPKGKGACSFWKPKGRGERLGR